MRSPTILRALGALLSASLPLARAAPAQASADQALRNSAADTAMVVHAGRSPGGIAPAFALLGRLESARTASGHAAAPWPSPTSHPWPDAHQALLGRPSSHLRPPAREAGTS